MVALSANHTLYSNIFGSDECSKIKKQIDETEKRAATSKQKIKEITKKIEQRTELDQKLSQLIERKKDASNKYLTKKAQLPVGWDSKPIEQMSEAEKAAKAAKDTLSKITDAVEELYFLKGASSSIQTLRKQEADERFTFQQHEKTVKRLSNEFLEKCKKDGGDAPIYQVLLNKDEVLNFEKNSFVATKNCKLLTASYRQLPSVVKKRVSRREYEELQNMCKRNTQIKPEMQGLVKKINLHGQYFDLQNNFDEAKKNCKLLPSSYQGLPEVVRRRVPKQEFTIARKKCNQLNFHQAKDHYVALGFDKNEIEKNKFPSENEIVARCKQKYNERAQKNINDADFKKIEKACKTLRFEPGRKQQEKAVAPNEIQELERKILAGTATAADKKKLAELKAKKAQDSEKISVADALIDDIKAGKRRKYMMAPFLTRILTQIPIPDVGGRLFGQDLALTDVRFLDPLELPQGKKFLAGVGITGNSYINNAEVEGTALMMLSEKEYDPDDPDDQKVLEEQRKQKLRLRSRQLAIASDEQSKGMWDKAVEFVAGPSTKTKNLGGRRRRAAQETEQQQILNDLSKLKKANNFSVSLSLPPGTKLSDFFRRLTILDRFSLPGGSFTVSNFNYDDIKKGFNFNAFVDLSGPLELINKIKNKVSLLKAVVVESDPVTVRGVIPKNVLKTEFEGKLPLRIGIDLTQIPKMPKTISNVFQKITTDDFVFKVEKDKLKLEGGLQMLIKGQDLQRFTLSGELRPQMMTYGAHLKSMIEFGPVALGNASVEIDIDEILLGAALVFGIPFTGFGVKGEIQLGRAEEQRTKLQAAAKVSVRSDRPLGDLLFSLKGENISFTDLIVFLGKMAAKAKLAPKFDPGKIPTLLLKKVRGHLALADMSVGGVPYSQGFRLGADALFFNHRGNFDININTKEDQRGISGNGSIGTINIKRNGKTLIKLDGPGPDGEYNTSDDGPVFKFRFLVKDPKSAMFGMNAKLSIPLLKINQAVEMEFSKDRFMVMLLVDLGMLKSEFGIDLDPAKPQSFKARFEFKGDFGAFLSEQAVPALKSLENKAVDKLRKLESKIKELSLSVKNAKISFGKKTDDEIEKTREEITKAKDRISDLKKECSQASKWKKSYVCPNVGRKIAGVGIKLGALETYLEGLLKPGKKGVSATLDATATVSGKIADSEALVKTTQALVKTTQAVIGTITQLTELAGQGMSIFTVKKVRGYVSGEELMQGKSPKIETLSGSVNLPGGVPEPFEYNDLQFSFVDLAGSGKSIATKILSNALDKLANVETGVKNVGKSIKGKFSKVPTVNLP